MLKLMLKRRVLIKQGNRQPEKVLTIKRGHRIAGTSRHRRVGLMRINVHPVIQIEPPVDLIDGHGILEIKCRGVRPSGTVLPRRTILPHGTAGPCSNAGATGTGELAHSGHLVRGGFLTGYNLLRKRLARQQTGHQESSQQSFRETGNQYPSPSSPPAPKP